MKYGSSQRGSALFIIMVAIVLFAALSYTVAQMMRGGNPETMNKDTVKLYTTEILDYARAMRQTIQTMRIGNGCSETEISFENATVGGYNFATSDKCKVFHPSGGGLNFIEAQESWLNNPAEEWRFTGRVCVRDAGTGGAACNTDADDTNEDLVMALGELKRDLCLEINTSLGVSNPSGNPPANVTAVSFATQFTGSYAQSGKIDSGAGGELDGRMAGCFYRADSGNYIFYQVLIAR